jgi:lipoprotein-anchoring transpeptidase ErfK/SrfK
MGEALTIPESTSRLRQKHAHRLLNRRIAARLVLSASIVAGLAFAFVYQSQTEADRLELMLSARRDAVATYVADVKVGMTAAQLAGDKQTLDGLNSQPPPARLFLYDFQRMDFWSRQREAYLDLSRHLTTSRETLVADLQQQVLASAAAAAVAADGWRQVGGTAEEVDTLAGGAAKLGSDGRTVTTIPDLSKMEVTINKLVSALQTGRDQQLADNQAQVKHAAEELPLATSDIAATHQRADNLRVDALGNADAASHYHIAGTDRSIARIIQHTAQADAATTPEALAGAIGWLRSDTDRLQLAMVAGMPDKAIYVSVGRQELRAYEKGNLVRQTLVTTGRPELPTDIGSFSVLRKNHPWTMHSPFPRSSPFWYPDTVVQFVLWFNDDGSGLHDAYWRSRFGPGTNGAGRSGGTHGCINMPTNVTIWMYDWAPLGTPVVVG